MCNTKNETKKSSILTPKIRMKWNGEKIKNIHVDFLGDITQDGKFDRTEFLGGAIIQLVNQLLLSKLSIDYISLKNENPSMFHYATELEDFVKCISASKNRPKGNVAILEHIEIFSPFRGKGLSKAFIWMILKTLKEQLSVDYVFLKPFPYEMFKKVQKHEATEEELLQEKIRLERLYLKAGFQTFRTKKIIKSIEGYILNFMYMNLTNKLFTNFSY